MSDSENTAEIRELVGYLTRGYNSFAMPDQTGRAIIFWNILHVAEVLLRACERLDRLEYLPRTGEALE